MFCQKVLLLINYSIITLYFTNSFDKTSDFKKSFFNEKYNIISDRDLLMRISLKEKFGCVQLPLAIYRIHQNNFSGKNKLMEVKELQNWIEILKKGI